MAIKASTITTGASIMTMGGSITTMEDSTITMEDFTTTTTMVDFTITTMEASVRVSRVITDANASTASHSATGMAMSTVLASGEIAVGERGATPQGGTTGPAKI